MYLSLRGVFMSLSRLWVSSHHSVCTDAHQGVLFSTGPLHWLLLLHRAQTAVVCVWARCGEGRVAIAIIMPGRWRGDALYTKCVCWQLFLLSSSFFFFYPHEVETASHWWTMLLLLWTIKKIRAELPSVRQHVYLCWYLCVCVSVCVWVCLALFNLDPYIFKVTP